MIIHLLDVAKVQIFVTQCYISFSQGLISMMLTYLEKFPE